MSSRPFRGLCFEAVQLTVRLSYLPDGLDWPGLTLARSLCFLFFHSFCLLLRHTPPPSISPFFPPPPPKKKKEPRPTVCLQLLIHNMRGKVN